MNENARLTARKPGVSSFSPVVFHIENDDFVPRSAPAIFEVHPRIITGAETNFCFGVAPA